jgi:hypothetical protein
LNKTVKPWDTIFQQEGRFFNEPHQALPGFVEQLNQAGAQCVLDLGCGSGRHVVYLAQQGFEVYGLDNSPNGLELTQRWLSEAGAGLAGSVSFTGWGGRISDRMTGTSNPSALIPMITSINGAQLFTAGQTTLPLAIANATTGLNQVLNPQGFNDTAASQARMAAFNQLRMQDLGANYVAAASHITDQAMQANAALNTFNEVTVNFPTSNIGQQLKQVARLIKKRTDLTINRQIFYCQLGGFDTHNNQVLGQSNLLSQLGQAMRAFYDEMVTQGEQNNVTTFTMTDFGRTMNPAGSGAAVGSDHAWANHLFVIGRASNTLRPRASRRLTPFVRRQASPSRSTGVPRRAARRRISISMASSSPAAASRLP